MAIEKKTVIDQIEINRYGDVSVRFSLELQDSATGEVFASKYHRTAFTNENQVLPTMALVNQHLTKMGFPIVDAADTLDLRDKTAVSKQSAKARGKDRK